LEHTGRRPDRFPFPVRRAVNISGTDPASSILMTPPPDKRPPATGGRNKMAGLAAAGFYAINSIEPAGRSNAGDG